MNAADALSAPFATAHDATLGPVLFVDVAGPGISPVPNLSGSHAAGIKAQFLRSKIPEKCSQAAGTENPESQPLKRGRDDGRIARGKNDNDDVWENPSRRTMARLANVLLLQRNVSHAIKFYSQGLGLKVAFESPTLAELQCSSGSVIALKQVDG